METFLYCIAPLMILFGLMIGIARATLTPTYAANRLLPPHNLNRLGEQKVCEYCDMVNVASAYTCVKCKREFGSMSMTHPTIETMRLSEELRTQVNDGKVQVCRNCGRLNSPTRTTCKTCQGDLSA